MPGLTLSGFTTPAWFLLLIVVAALAATYVLVLRLRRRYALRFANLASLERLMPGWRDWARHTPAALLGVALILLVVGLSGPTAEAKIPRNRATVILAIDVSMSMQASDIDPTRLVAAQEAAKRFAAKLPAGMNLGLVSFAGSATVLAMPTTDRQQISQAIDGLRLSEATATGEGLQAALNSIDSFGKMLGGGAAPPARIVLMSDGKETIPADENAPRGSFTIARQARKSGIPVSTIAFGTQHGTVDIDGNPAPVPTDVPAMKEIASLSGGDFFEATSADEVNKVYDTLGQQIGYETKRTDASKPWLMLGTFAALAAAGWSVFLSRRLP